MSNLVKISKCLSFSNYLSTIDSQDCIPVGMKILYEFWGFCVNGGDSTTVPNAISTHTFPIGISGSVLTGTDGSTLESTPGVFTAASVDWTSYDLTDKFLVIWKPDDETIDDSIYEIKYVNVDGNLVVNQDSGGGTVSYGNKLSFADRTNINYRVVDIATSKDLAWADAQYMIIDFSGSSDVNTGQANAQAQLVLRNTQRRLGVVISPSGSWTGASFSDGTSETVTSSDMITGTATQPYYYVAASKDGLIMLFDGVDNAYSSDYGDNAPSGLHIEIPKRLYTEELDPNPVMWLVWSRELPSFESVSSSYYSGISMVDHDNTVRTWNSLVRSPWGTSNTEFLTTGGPPWKVSASERHKEFDLEQYERFVISSDIILSNISSTHFSYARCRLRFVRAGSVIQPRGRRHGRSFAHVINGVIMPWDNSNVSFGRFWGVK